MPKLKSIFCKFLVIALIATISGITPAFSQETYSARVSKKLMEIATSSQKITKKEYDDFWNSTGIKSRDQKINFINSMRYNFILIQEFNKILWDCAEKAWVANKKIKCQELNNNLNKIKTNLISEIGEDEFKKVENNFNYIIETASNRGIDKNNPNANIQPANMITLEKIKIAKINTQNLLDRINILLQPDFRNN